MCVAILQKAGKTIIPKDEFMGYGRCNPDGFGMLYVDSDGKLKSIKTMSLNDFREMYEFINGELGQTSPILIHFRLGTSGGKNVDNCHPFMVNDDLGFIHNGIINIKATNDAYSDTWNFNENILKDLGRDIIDNTTTQELVKDWVGGTNKLLFLTSKKETFILNEDAGEWSTDKQVWYSFKKYPYYSNYSSRRSNYSTSSNYTHSEYACCSCKICGCHMIKANVITILNYAGEPNYICDTCVNTKTRISEVVDVYNDLGVGA